MKVSIKNVQLYKRSDMSVRRVKTSNAKKGKQKTEEPGFRLKKVEVGKKVQFLTTHITHNGEIVAFKNATEKAIKCKLA